MSVSKAKASFNWSDPLLLDQQLTADERMVRDAAAAYCQDKLAAARAGSLPPREDRSGDLPRDGRTGPAGPDHSRAVRRPRPELRRLRPDRARSRARRFRLPLDDERAVVAGDGADLRIRHRSDETEIPAEAGHRRMDRLLRPDRAEPRLRSRLDGHARQEGGGRLSLIRQQDVDFQFARSPTCSWCGPRTTKARFAASCWKKAGRD